MNKLQSLRNTIAAAFEWLRDNPQALVVFAERGTFADSLSEPGTPFDLGYAYTARIILTDFAGDLREVTAVIWEWIRTHQPDLAQNAERRALVTFEVEFLSNKMCDLQIDIPMTEHAAFTPRDGGGFVVTDGPEPAWLPDDAPAGWEGSIELEDSP